MRPTLTLHLAALVAGLQLQFPLLSAAYEETPHTRTFTFVGGAYTPSPLNASEHLHTDQLYVEILTPYPRPLRRRPAILLLHGAAQTGTNFLNTPDGRPGWASHFLSAGHVVYIPDQRHQGRSPTPPNTPLIALTAEYLEKYFTDTATHNLWPQARLHTQWPGTGRVGDGPFDRWYRANVAIGTDDIAQQTHMTASLADLVRGMDGDVVVVAHSQAGFWAWTLADRVGRAKVRAVVALEPPGPPGEDKVVTWGAATRRWGLADIPLSYDPPVPDPDAPLPLGPWERVGAAAETDEKSSCLQQRAPARKLKVLQHIPALVVTSQASYHAVYDHCTVAFLRQAGVKVTGMRLEKVGLHGNGHMFFMEKNSGESWRLVQNWIDQV